MEEQIEENKLTKQERRALKKERKREEKSKERRARQMRKLRNVVIGVVVLVVIIFGYRQLTMKSPEEAAFEQRVEEVSLEGRVEEFPVEGINHVPTGQDVNYSTNPPTSGNHWPQPANWGFYTDELPDEQVVHSLEHGGIWITHNSLNQQSVEALEQIARRNSGSVVVSPRTLNDDRIVVASWGRMMRLDSADSVLIQKYIDTFKNQSPEPLAR